MSASLTEKFSLNNLSNLFNDINSTGNTYYFFVGDTTPWANGDSNPPQAQNDYEEFELSIYNDIVFGKLLTNNNIAYLTPNIPWTNNTLYAQYDQNSSNLFSEAFYVVNQNSSVYKCIDNNNGINSTAQPLITPTTGTFQTADGYSWKYLYTIPSSQNTIFTTNNYIPIVPNTVVSSAAIPGTIDIIRTLNGGSNWQGCASGYIQNLIDQNSVQITNGVNIDNFYTGSSIYLLSGFGASQLREIISYNGSTQAVTVSPNFNVGTSLYLNQNYTGLFPVGEYIQQNYTSIQYIFGQGSFNVGDSVYQPATNAHGILIGFSPTTAFVQQTSSVANSFEINFPVIDSAAIQVDQGVTATALGGSNNIVSGGANGTANLLNYSVGQYIRISATTTNTNIRRITSISSANAATVLTNFPSNVVANELFIVPTAFQPVTNTIINANGIIIQTNLTSITVSYANLSSNSLSFILGETLKEYNSLGVDQHSNGVVSFVNSSVVVLSSINGVFSSGLNIIGQTSSLQATITSISNYPYIVVSNVSGQFISGNPINAVTANGSSLGSANLLSSSVYPSLTTQYIISPTVTITGDGEGAQAYSIVNTAIGNNFTISDIQMINVGNNYTEANVVISANSLYGSGANLYPVISPITGHGANAYMELGARYAGISMTIDTIANESYYFPGYGSYRRVGIIKNPLYNQLTVNTDNVHRYQFNIQLLNPNNFVNGEIIYQYSDSAAAKIISANSTVLIVDTVNGLFTTNAISNSVNNVIVGLTSLATANVISSNSFQFQLASNTQIITNESNSSANGLLAQVVTNNQIVLTNVSGKFVANTLIFDATTNAYANALSLFGANGTTNVTSTFGQRFLQTSRVSLSTFSFTPFQVGEYVLQNTSNASGLVIDTTHEVDIAYTANFGTVGAGSTLTDANNSGTGVITFANSTYIRLTCANGVFNVGDVISTIAANGNITAVYPVLVISDVQPSIPFLEGTFNIIGQTSGAQGINGIANTILYPDLVRNTGDVIYVNDLSPFTLGANSKSTFNMVFQL